MRMRSIKWKLIIMYLGLVLIVMIVSGTYILLSLRRRRAESGRYDRRKISESGWESLNKQYRNGYRCPYRSGDRGSVLLGR